MPRIASVLGLAGLVAFFASVASGHAAICEDRSIDGTAYTICTVEAGRGDLRLYLRDGTGRPYATFSQLAAALAQTNETLVFAMNPACSC